MSRPYLSPAQLAALHDAIHGKPAKARALTLQSLHRKGMLAGVEHRPTAAGIAVFRPARAETPLAAHGTAPLPSSSGECS